MGDKKHENKATRKSISLETKMQIDTSERQSQIGATSNLARIRKNTSSATATTTSSATGITCSKNNTVEEMKKRLSIWIEDEIEHNMPLS
ncbi:hypothetical protein TNCV_1023941 [Trichonephila clavipes]|nr:hypothetical protein TNCV_1023941 [Trichonephila clavipes]